MQAAPIPADEQARQIALDAMSILDTPPEPRFDRITKQVAERFQVPITTLSVIDHDREWFKSCQGLPDREGKRAISFCGHAMLSKFVFIVEDTKLDERFADNPYVTGKPHIRFYAGMALRDRDSGQPVGVLCIKDTKPRSLSAQDVADFLDYAQEAEDELNHHQT